MAIHTSPTIFWLSAIGYRLIFGVLIASLSWSAHAACTFFDGFKDNRNGTVTDPRNGLVWKRCAEGMAWDGTSCTGLNAKAMDWFAAMRAAKTSKFLGRTDWRLPSKEELASVVGDSLDCKSNSFPKDNAASKIAFSPVRDDGFFGVFHSFTPHMGNGVNGAWVVSFYNGEIADNGWTSGRYSSWTRLVRVGDEDNLAKYEQEYKRLAYYKDKLNREVANIRNAKEEVDQESREREQAAARACSNLYVGKPVGVRVSEYLFGPKRPLDAVITGIGNGRAAYKIVDSIYTSHYGQTGEMSCSAY
jgi:hypothetical protein